MPGIMNIIAGGRLGEKELAGLTLGSLVREGSLFFTLLSSQTPLVFLSRSPSFAMSPASPLGSAWPPRWTPFVLRPTGPGIKSFLAWLPSEVNTNNQTIKQYKQNKQTMVSLIELNSAVD